MQPIINQNMSKLKVNIYIINEVLFIWFLQGPSNPKYKTSLCKKFETGKGCPYGDRCQFAHGEQELHLYSSQNMMNMYN